MNYRIAVLAGDGIGPEICAGATKVLEKVGKKFGHSFEFEHLPIGGVAIDNYGTPLPDFTVEKCLKADSVLLGAVGAPVFAGAGAGAAVLFGPTGGYLIGYLAQALIGGWAVERSGGRVLWSGLGLAAGVAVSYAFGTAWFILQMGCTLPYALTVCVLPFIPFDAAKVALASVLGSILRRALHRAGLLHHN